MSRIDLKSLRGSTGTRRLGLTRVRGERGVEARQVTTTASTPRRNVVVT